jgi:D-alanyl-D-alanine carboxypeptidase/D-alanyl-D-alanine-endopeptidase (penicillin-binding protein 4)
LICALLAGLIPKEIAFSKGVRVSRMKQITCSLALSFWSLLGPLALAGFGPAAARADVGGEVQAVLQESLMHKATVGVDVIRLGAIPADARDVYGHDAAIPRIPASNLKLATTSAALDHFGPDFKFRTILFKHGDDLVLIGDGDPTFGDSEYLRKVGWQVTTVYEGWAAQLRKMNVAAVHDVIVDDGIFDQEFFHPHWPADQLEQHYMAQVAGMNLNENLIGLIVEPTSAGARVNFSLDPATQYVSVMNRCLTGSRNSINLARQIGTNTITMTGQTPGRGAARVETTVHDPPLYAAQVLAETLAAGGVKVIGQARRDRTARQQRIDAGAAGAGQWAIIGIHETPISTVLGRANKDSVNLYAESLCKRLGADLAKSSGTWQNGTAAVAAFLKRVGISDSEFQLDDGCGLSKENRISPHALATVLGYDFAGKNHNTFFDSLSVAGVDGTLEHRFDAPAFRDLRQRVFGKSGFVEGVSTLSGLLKAKDNQWYAFSIMMNGIPRGSNSDIKPLQERIVRAIDNDASASAAARP